LVQVAIKHYQFPGAVPAGQRDWDANWLVIGADVQLADGKRWSFQDPCLTTWEARSLGRWLRDVSADREAPAGSEAGNDRERLLMFTEPCLAFSLAAREAGRLQLRVHFSLQALPPWLHSGSPPDIWDYFVFLDTSAGEMAEAAGAWEAELARFPER
jgi:hypothetical protein